MPDEVGQYLINDPGGVYVDLTLGGGGHSSILLKEHKDIKIIGVDQDQTAIETASQNLSVFSHKITIIKSNFSDIAGVFAELQMDKVSGFLLDLGVSSRQLDNKDRGFSFLSDNLDMRMDTSQGISASDVVNTYSKEKLAEIFKVYGEEYMGDRIADAIVNNRKISPIISGKSLSDVVSVCFY